MANLLSAAAAADSVVVVAVVGEPSQPLQCHARPGPLAVLLALRLVRKASSSSSIYYTTRYICHSSTSRATRMGLVYNLKVAMPGESSQMSVKWLHHMPGQVLCYHFLVACQHCSAAKNR
jgi:hypothetical protein